MVLEEGIGPVRVGVRLRPGAAPFAEFDAPKLPQEIRKLLGLPRWSPLPHPPRKRQAPFVTGSPIPVVGCLFPGGITE